MFFVTYMAPNNSSIATMSGAILGYMPRILARQSPHSYSFSGWMHTTPACASGPTCSVPHEPKKIFAKNFSLFASETHTVMALTRSMYGSARERLSETVEERMRARVDTDLKTYFQAFARAQMREMSVEELQVHTCHTYRYTHIYIYTPPSYIQTCVRTYTHTGRSWEPHTCMYTQHTCMHTDTHTH